MIDILLVGTYNYNESLVLLSMIMTWVMKKLDEDHDKYGDVYLQGSLIIHDKIKAEGLLICNNTSQQKIYEILQQPPGEFKGKYSATIINSCEEDPVAELVNHESETMKDDDEDEDVP